MTSEQPENDPFRKQEPPHAPPPPSPGDGGTAHPGSSPYDGGPYPGSPYEGGSPYERGPAAGSPYGEPDPLAGMPPLASRGLRLLARIVDALIVGIPVGIVMALLNLATTSGDAEPWDSGNTVSQSIVYQLVYLVYEGLMLTRSGQTLGKKLVKVRVAVLQNGQVPHGSPGWIRALTYSIPPVIPCIGSLFWLVNVLFCTWDKPYRQCLHDKVAKTVVVSADQPAGTAG